MFLLFIFNKTFIVKSCICCGDSIVRTNIQLNNKRKDSTKCTKRKVNALSDWTVAAVGKGDGYVAHCGPHLCLCNFGNFGYQSVTTK